MNAPPWPEFPTQRGTYALLLRAGAPLSVQVGRLGHFTLAAGLYVYVGSAHGAGGLRARVGRHLRAEKKAHWHIDALTARLPVIAVAWSVAPERLECVWAARVAALADVGVPIPRFGASDCRCAAHLFAVPHAQIPALWRALAPVQIAWRDGSALGRDPEGQSAPQQ